MMGAADERQRDSGADAAPRWRFVAAIAVGCTAGLLPLAACGGSTGRDSMGSSTLAFAEAGVGASIDATTSAVALAPADAGLFDVTILYADRDLPEVSAAVPSSGGDGGDAGPEFPWPNCPADILVNRMGLPLVDGGTSVPSREIPSEYTDDGGVVPAPDGSACANYVWYGYPAPAPSGDGGAGYKDGGDPSADRTCLAKHIGYIPSSPGDYHVLAPPCSWCTGTAVQGAYALKEKRWICENLYQCMTQSHCATDPDAGDPMAGPNPTNCLCGHETYTACAMDPNPPGACAKWELGALEVSMQTQGAVESALTNFTFIGDPRSPYFCAGALNSVYSDLAQGSTCQ